ncbi:hypothetical protein MSAN_02282300 [Mycena sanguinolenta]|uniref:Uncharacterized protein n=1 Tax=Mycena sanguinolenta TaxID=230812 RepID=A0A8H6XAZ3_9AGAR|nr:hypothetical protein MSAN_02282300 [Mycena sanguinolenta]
MQQLLFAYWLQWKTALTVVVSSEFKSFGCAPFFKSLTRWTKAVNSAPIPPWFPPSSSMDPQAESDEGFIVLSTSDYADSESTSVISPHASKRPKNVEPFIKSFSFLPSLLRGSSRALGTSEVHTRKYWETKPRRQATEHTVNKYYSYHITGGFGGSGGQGGDQGGDGGTGQGPTVYFGQPQAPEVSGIQTIRLEDINLMKTIRLDPHSDVVGCRSRGVGVRRIYHAEIRGNPGTVTVVMYQGDGAEDEWRQNVAKYESIR